MSSRRQVDSQPAYRKDILRELEEFFVEQLRNNLKVDQRRKRQLCGRLTALAAREVDGWKYLLLLANVRTRPEARIRLLTSVLRAAPPMAEVHASLALAFAEKGNRNEARSHAERAIRLCARDPLCELTLEDIQIAARIAGLPDLVQRALRIGRRRFPRSPLFESDRQYTWLTPRGKRA